MAWTAPTLRLSWASSYRKLIPQHPTRACHGPVPRLKGLLMSAAIKHVSDATFDKDVLQSGNPVLVDFWAEWCGPCKMFAPVLDEIAKQYDGKVTVAKLDIDANPSTPGKYGIRGIPTLILYKGGQPHAQKVGALTKSQLTAFLDSNL